MYESLETDFERDPPHLRRNTPTSEKVSVFQTFHANIKSRQEAKLVIDLVGADLKEKSNTFGICLQDG